MALNRGLLTSRCDEYGSESQPARLDPVSLGASSPLLNKDTLSGG